MATLHPPVDEYLRTILELEEEGTPVIQARLAERMGISAPSVSEMVKRLERNGFLRVASDRHIQLTTTGTAHAEKIERRHRLAECLLIDILGLEWSLAHEEAEKFEHVISDAVEERIIKILNRPTTCPHGNPIPGLHSGEPDGYQALSSVEQGATVVLRRVTEDVEIDYPTMRYLDGNGFIPGRRATVTGVAPDGSITLTTAEGAVLSIGGALAGDLYVERASVASRA